MYKLFLILLFCLTATFSQSAAYSQSNSSHHSLYTEPKDVKKRYQRAKFYYNQLETNISMGKQRKNWLKGVRNFRKIYLTSSKSDIAPACLFMLGRMYNQMFERFNTLIDLNESLSYYRDTATLFPQHKLADDALYAIGVILLKNKKNIKGASKAFDKIVSDYPGGDMHPQAASQLKILSRDHDIPLPEVMVGAANHKKLTNVLPVKYWSSDNYTRIVVKASDPVTYREELIEPSGDRPRRLYIDFYNSYIEPRYRSPVPIENGLLKRIRTGQFSSDIVRVVLDIESISSYKVFSLPDPFRVVIDVRGNLKKVAATTKKSHKRNVEADIIPDHPGTPVIVLKDRKKYRVGKKKRTPQLSVPAIQSQQPISLAQQLGLGVRKIVLDPGHGGKDAGAMAFGMKEKDIVLKLALKLAPILQRQLGCEVILTRTTDKYIPLEERTAIANTSGADLFISLHINAHPASKVHGLETYYLNLTTNAEAMRVAALENATSTHQMSDLQDILSDILQNSKVHESSRLAKLVHHSIIGGLSSTKTLSIKNLGVKQAPFYVLIGAQMPSILLEIAFLSNPGDAKRLRNERFLDTISQEIGNGIQSYIRGTVAGLNQNL